MNWPSRPDIAPARMRTRSTGGGGMTRFGRSNTSIGGSVDDRDLEAGQGREHGLDRARQRPARGPVEDEDRERREPVEGGPLARLRREEVAALLAGETRHDDAADAHRPGPRQRLGIDPRADDEDRPGRPDVETARAQFAVGAELEAAAGRAAERDDPADAAAGRPDRDAGARAGRRGRSPRTASRARSVMSPVATRQRPCHSKTYSPVGPLSAPRRAWPAQRAPGRGAGRRLGQVDLVEARVAQPLGDGRPDHDRIAGGDQRPVAGREREQRVDGR